MNFTGLDAFKCILNISIMKQDTHLAIPAH